jgi:hypothetical protein
MEMASQDKSADAGSAQLLASNKQRIRVGPPQDSNIRSAKKIPPQVHLKRMEKILHKITRGVAMEHVHPPNEFGSARVAEPVNAKEKEQAEISEALRKKKIQLDEFDRMLGLQSESMNPITRITATFLGPLMRIFKVFIVVFRIAFHVSTWRDPYMSFWVCVALAILCSILIWFPWRSFFLLVTVATVGPQVSCLALI